MRLLPLFLLLACGGTKIELGEETGAVDETDADTDSDADTDADSDTDTAVDDTGDTSGTTPPAPIADIVVDCEGGEDFTTIQDAIDASVSGDRIGLMPCEYHERIDFLGKAIDVFGLEGSAVTEIDGDASGTVVNVENGEVGARLAGVTIDDGYDADGGAAIEVDLADLALEDIVVTGASGSLAIFWFNRAWVDLTDVVVVDNTVPEGAQAIYSDGGSFTATGLDVDCDAGAYGIWQHNATVVSDSEIVCRTGIALYSYHGELNVVRSRLEGGVAGIWTEDEEDSPDERAWVYNSYLSGAIGYYGFWVDTHIVNSVVTGTDAAVELVGNDASSAIDSSVVTGATCGVSGDSVVNLAYTDFWDNGTNLCDTVRGTVVYEVDPQFVSWPDDLHLGARSPLVDAGNPQNDDVDGTRNDVGMYGGETGWD